jgi:hypothetical protein
MDEKEKGEKEKINKENNTHTRERTQLCNESLVYNGGNNNEMSGLYPERDWGIERSRPPNLNKSHRCKKFVVFFLFPVVLFKFLALQRVKAPPFGMTVVSQGGVP